MRWLVEPQPGTEVRLPRLWTRAEDSQRWEVFRLSNFAHNTLVIDGQPQRVGGFASVTPGSAEPSSSVALVDLTPLYAGQAAAFRRGFALPPSGDVIVRDELSGLRAGSQVRWGVPTPAQVTRRSAASVVLHQKGRTMVMESATESGAPPGEWTISDVSAPRQTWDSPNPGITLLALNGIAPEGGSLVLVVVVATRPSRVPDEASWRFALQPLSSWH